MNPIQYCLLCGTLMDRAIPPGDNLPRDICRQCGYIHYENPRVIVGCLATWGDEILLCRRAIEPRYGLWTLPAGFMENGESTAEGALRETSEEAGAQVIIERPLALISIPRINQVHLFYLGRMTSSDLLPGEESLDAQLFTAADLPWQALAFSSVRYCLERFLADRERGEASFHEIRLEPGVEPGLSPAEQSG